MTKTSSSPRSSRSPRHANRGDAGLQLQPPPVPTAPTAATDSSWVSVATAATFLGLSADRLRKTLERYSRKVDGSIHSEVDGVTARKFGRLWRVRFSSSWTKPEGA